jgi:hypothetical protein
VAPRALAASLSKIVRPAFERRGRTLARLLAAWPEIVGEALAAETAPERLVPGRGGPGGTLHLRAAPGAGLAVQHEEPQLVERINAFLGAGLVTRLRLVQAPLAAAPSRRVPRPPPRPADPKRVAAIGARVARIDEPELRAALARLGAALAARGGG